MSLTEVDSRLPAGLVSVVMRCLNKSVDERYARGDELADALLEFLSSTEDAGTPRRSAALARRPVPSERA